MSIAEVKQPEPEWVWAKESMDILNGRFWRVAETMTSETT
jgi:hypothetical protein